MSSNTTPVKVTIDGREIAVEAGTTILRAASDAGIYIPHLCYHRDLSIKGSCRVCLVEVEGTPKLQPACSTVVCEGMKVRTDSPQVRDSRSAVLELLLVNHPLDCPVCDKGGECKLQDYVFWYGKGRGRFAFDKRTFAREDIGPFVVRDANRCVLCTRCVRFTSEIAFTDEIATFDRGERTSIGTYLGGELRGPLSGNVTELCPVGALTDRIFRFKARTWDLENVNSACPLCPAGCLTELQLANGRIARIRSRKKAVDGDNGGNAFGRWICDLGRFGFAGVVSGCEGPSIKEGGRSMAVPWDVALGTVAGRLRVISKENGPGSIGVLCGPLATNEEIYALQHVFRDVFHCHNIDFRTTGAVSFGVEEAETLRDALESQAGVSDLRGCDFVLLLCADPCEETPVVGAGIMHAIRSAAGEGVTLVAVGPRRPEPCALSIDWLPLTPDQSALLLFVLARELAVRTPAARESFEALGEFAIDEVAGSIGLKPQTARSVLDSLVSSTKPAVVVGRQILSSASACGVLSSVLRLRAARNALGAGETVLISLLGNGNVRGALEFGALPVPVRAHAWEHPRRGEEEAARGKSREGGDAKPEPAQRKIHAKSFGEMLEAAKSGTLKALFVFGSDPLSECEDWRTVEEALAKIEFLVVQSETVNATAARADVYLPLQSIFEREGSFVDLEGRMLGLRPQASEAGSRSFLFDVLDSICRVMSKSLKFRDAASVFSRIKTSYGWNFTGDLKELAAGTGAPLYQKTAGSSEAWALLRGFEKRVISGISAGAGVEDRPMVLLTGVPGVTSWVWARGVSQHPLVPVSAFGEISRADAEKLGIENGDTIEIESPQGSIRVHAAVTKHLMEGVVFVPSGYDDANPGRLVAEGEPVTRVKVAKV